MTDDEIGEIGYSERRWEQDGVWFYGIAGPVWAWEHFIKDELREVKAQRFLMWYLALTAVYLIGIAFLVGWDALVGIAFLVGWDALVGAPLLGIGATLAWRGWSWRTWRMKAWADQLAVMREGSNG